MASTANSDTMIEGLKSLLTDLAKLKVLPDADLSFIGDVENMIVQYVRNAGQQTVDGAVGQQAQGGGMGQPGGIGDATMGMGFGQAPPAQQIAPGGGAGMSGLAPQAPNGDELRRILQGPTG